MKRIICSILTIIIIISAAAVMGGCSDFSFNPLGSWRYTDDILYVDGKVQDHATIETMNYKNVYYNFEKSGTGYISVEGDRALNFTYDYNDTEVILHTVDPFYNEKKKDITFKLKYDGDTKKLIRTDEETVEDNGKKTELKEEHILTKI